MYSITVEKCCCFHLKTFTLAWFTFTKREIITLETNPDGFIFSSRWFYSLGEKKLHLQPFISTSVHRYTSVRWKSWPFCLSGLERLRESDPGRISHCDEQRTAEAWVLWGVSLLFMFIHLLMLTHTFSFSNWDLVFLLTVMSLLFLSAFTVQLQDDEQKLRVFPSLWAQKYHLI